MWKIRSKDQDASLEEATEIKRILAEELPYVQNLSLSLDQGSPELLISVDREKAALFGFSVSQVAQEITNSIYGTAATTLRNRRRNHRRLYPTAGRGQENLVGFKVHILISSSGTRIPVSSFVTISNSTAPRQINRENKERILHVTGDLPANFQQSSTEMAQIVQNVLDERYIPRTGVTVSVGGENRDVDTFLPVLMLIIAVAVFLVYGVMASQFESFIDPLIIFLSIPLMFIGVVWIYRLTGDTLSLFSMIGLWLWPAWLSTMGSCSSTTPIR
jgi:multidrug efflux pump subunit AcrB